MAHVGDYVPRVTEALELADQVGPFDMVLYNAGMDPANSGVSASELRQRENLVAEWTHRHGYPLVYALARWLHRRLLHGGARPASHAHR
jgi:hypothetical protein